LTRIAIAGGGISGLTCAYRLQQAGCAVTLFEAGATLGGLGRAFRHEGVALDRFYHVMLDSDTSLIRLVGELGGRVRWVETGMGIHAGGRLHPMNSPGDLLRFSPLSIIQRLRTALGAAYLTRILKDGRPLDQVSAASYLRRLFGDGAYQYLWEPMLRAKFGDWAEEVPAYWIWSRLNREKSGGPERKGYPEGGYQWIADTLAQRLRDGGAEIRMETPAGDVSDGRMCGEAFDAVIDTRPLRHLRYMGVVNVLLLLKQRLQPYYWSAVIDRTYPFQGVVETTHVLRPEWTGGHHLVYLMNYCAADSAAYSAPEAELLDQCLTGLARLYADFQPQDCTAGYVFRAPHVEPVWPLGYLRGRPPVRVGERNFQCTTAQLYPAVNAWNSCVAQAGAVAEEVVRTVIR